MPKTLADHFSEQSGDSDPARLNRLCKLIVDGRPLGEYLCDIERTPAEWKRHEEIQWAAIALVGCDIDLLIKELRVLPERGGITTPDFEATLKRGNIVKIELVRLVIEDELPQIKYYDQIGRQAQEALETGALSNAGEFLFRSQGALHSIGKQQAAAIAAELAQYISTEEKLAKTSTLLIGPRLYGRRDEFPLLTSLDIVVVHRRADKPVRVLWAPLPGEFDADQLIEDFISGSLRKKIDNFAKGYNADGIPVWLLVAIPGSPIDRFRAASLIYALREYDSLQIGPFERIMFGAKTCGVTFENGDKPVFTGITQD